MTCYCKNGKIVDVNVPCVKGNSFIVKLFFKNYAIFLSLKYLFLLTRYLCTLLSH